MSLALTILGFIVFGLLSVLVSVLILLLVLPLHLELNSARQFYGLRIVPLLFARLYFAHDDIYFEFGLVGWKRRQSVMQMLARPRSAKKRNDAANKTQGEDKRRADVTNTRASTINKKTKRPLPRWLQPSMSRVLSTVSSFRVRRAEIELDTGEDDWNAYLYPISGLLRAWTPIRLGINYEGHVSCNVLITNTIGHIIYRYFRSTSPLFTFRSTS